MRKAAAMCANTDNLTLCAAFDTVKGANSYLDQIHYNFLIKVLYQITSPSMKECP